MSVNELLQNLTRIFFVALALIPFIDFIRQRDKIRRDVALVFLSLSLNVILTIIINLSRVKIFDIGPLATTADPYLGVIVTITRLQIFNIGTLAVLAQPYLLLRLVRYFRSVPALVERAAFLGMIMSWGLVIVVKTPLPSWATLAVVAYFAIIDGYVIFAFVQGAFSTASVTRKRLQFAAAGSALLVATLVIGGIRVALPPAAAAAFIPITQIFSVLSALAYYLGFAPPRWLRQAWQLTELRNFLQYIQKSGDKTSTEILDSLCAAVTRVMGTTTLAAVVLWDEDQKRLILQKISSSPVTDLYLDGIVQEAWQKKTPLVFYKSSDLSSEDVRSIEKLNAETILIAPIATNDRVLGLVMVFFEYGSLFVDDDLNLLNIFASQTAVILENNIVLEELRHYTEDLEAKVEERTLALKRSNEELQQFAYVASHDLQEPLRSVISYLQLIEKRYADKLDESGHEFIAFAVEGGQRMKELITDLLAYSRVESESRVLTTVDCQKVFDEAYKFLEVAIKESQAVVTHEPLPKVRADERLLIQLFQNLIGNAIKYRSDKKPEIHVGVTFDNNQWLFSVRDNGIGIESAYIDRIFIIFQRLHNRTKYPGTGIGLAICKKAVEYHGGRIWAESEVGKGTTFYFTLPA
jgi:signal transduction histidine kinase